MGVIMRLKWHTRIWRRLDSSPDRTNGDTGISHYPHAKGRWHTPSRRILPDQLGIVTPDAIVKIERDRGLGVTVEGRWVNHGVSYTGDAVGYHTNRDGSRTLVEIRFS